MGCPSFKPFWALLANSSDGNRRTSVNDDFDVRHLSSASLAFARRAPFWPLALVQQAQAALFSVVRGLCGHFRFCALALGLTRRSSRPAYCGRLTLFVRFHFNQRSVEMAEVTYPCYWEKKDNSGQWYWIYYAVNGKAISRSSESYVNRADCEHSINIMKGSSDAKVFYTE